MKKTILTIVMALFAIVAFAQNEEVRTPSGYQGFFEFNNTWHFDKEMPTTIQLSTTHGFYFNGRVYAGIGLGFEWNRDFFLAPFYANIRYVFLNNTAVSPFLSLRLGSYASENIGAYGDLAIGARFASKRDFAVNIMLAGTYYDKISYEYYDSWYDDYGEWHSGTVQRNINPSGISLRVGIEW